MLNHVASLGWAEADMLACTIDHYTCVYAADAGRQPTQNATSCAFVALYCSNV